jgi:hypothetical protein
VSIILSVNFQIVKEKSVKLYRCFLISNVFVDFKNPMVIEDFNKKQA